MVRYSDMDAPHGGEERILKFAGPFYNGRVLDTIHMILEPHVGYGGSALGTSPCTVFFNGQPFQNTRPVFIEGQPNDACGNYYDSYIQLDLLN